MFRKNNFQQMRLDDPLNNMPKYLKEILENSWAHPFQKYIFPNINEERFEVLYSDNPASRPNSPVNVIIGLLVIKDLFDQTDEELIGSLYFDDRYQYALRTTSFEKQPVSINTLTNFRNRAYDYYEETGIDLIQQETEAISKLMAQYLQIDGQKARMDSFMVSSSCKNLSRIELVYKVNSNFIKLLDEISSDSIPKECKAYLEKGHKNETIYKTRNKDTESKLEFLLKQSKLLYEVGLDMGEKVTDTEEFKLLQRMLNEQTKDDDNSDQLVPKDNKEISSDSLQNPSDPDATYRCKYGDNIGYTVNVLEIFDENNSIITSYDLQPNIYDDSQFAIDVIDKISVPRSEMSLLVDGAYYSYEIAKKASSKNINLIPKDLRGRKPSNEKMSYSNFNIDENKNIISNCADDKIPVKSFYDEETNTYTAKFDKQDCKGCAYKSECRIQKQKKFNTVRFTDKEYQTAVLREQMSKKEYQKLVNKRSGIEGAPSTFRRKYNIDDMPIRGKERAKIWFGFKVIAYNFKKLLKGLEDLDMSDLYSLFFYIFAFLFTQDDNLALNEQY